ncbi:IclR family transcriptional regulator [Mycolicibacterium sp. S2-37]|uniref:IclR family transcriptional regulator n=1 Tax=Mycolicibacterium sp. S2-37 TaxID=2810297 RepID=UPI001A942160|nr:IclR family transcriptional regulator [Mycolicibacterium sp. S2-37]MBO0676293.1 IclR family transcriptional regulator [Mycolicibacterium sp. S2-37]
MARDEDRPAAAVQSVDRALLVLEILARAGQAGVTEIAAELDVHKSTASRLIAVLEGRGFVEQISGRGKYRLGFAIARLARAASGHLDLGRLSQDICDGLTDALGETTNVAILDENRIVNVVESIGPGEITLRTWVGQNCPAHATSSGKVLLAALDTAEVRTRLPEELPTFTPSTVAKLPDLLAELAEVRELGWSTVTEELEVGLNAVAAPVRDANHQVIAALSVSGPSYRMGEENFAEVAKRTVAAAEAISRRLGWIDSPR